MKILFSPSEAKISKKGVEFEKNSLIFNDFFEKRLEIVNKHKNSGGYIDLQNCIKAITRYSGVAYKALNYENLNEKSKKYIDENVLIFSNLFGVVSAKDLLPDYKLKQGNMIGDFNQMKFYKENLSKRIDDLLKNNEILDLRAKFYDKFYTIPKTYKYLSLKFTKNKKNINHYSKFYRGIVLSEIAKNNINNINDFLNLKINDLKLEKIENNQAIFNI